MPSEFRLFHDASTVRILTNNLLPKAKIPASPHLHWFHMPYTELSLVKWERYQYITGYKSIFGWARSGHSPFFEVRGNLGNIRSVCWLDKFHFKELKINKYTSEISTTRCNNCVFILRNGFTLHVSGDNLTHHQEYICCIGPQVSRLT